MCLHQHPGSDQKHTLDTHLADASHTAILISEPSWATRAGFSEWIETRRQPLPHQTPTSTHSPGPGSVQLMQTSVKCRARALSSNSLYKCHPNPARCLVMRAWPKPRAGVGYLVYGKSLIKWGHFIPGKIRPKSPTLYVSNNISSIEKDEQGITAQGLFPKCDGGKHPTEQAEGHSASKQEEMFLCTAPV